jgi:hypothetical protein
MPVSLQRFMRHPPGTRLGLQLTLPQNLIDFASPYFGDLADWLAAIKEGALHVEHVDDDRCALRFDSPLHRGRIEIRREEEGGLHLRAACENDLNWERRGLVAMLGGKHDVYLAQPATGGNQPFLKLRYEAQSVRVSILLAAFAHRVAPALRGFLPGEVPLGELNVAD